MILSDHWSDSLEMIFLKTVKINRGINSMCLSAPYTESYLNNCFEPPNRFFLDIFSLVAHLSLFLKLKWQYIFKNDVFYDDEVYK